MTMNILAVGILRIVFGCVVTMKLIKSIKLAYCYIVYHRNNISMASIIYEFILTLIVIKLIYF